MPALRVTVAVEGVTDVPVARRILEHVGFEPGFEYIAGGKSKLDSKLQGYNAAAKYSEWLVLRDLDHDQECAPDLVSCLLPKPAGKMCLRIAVRAVEAWLMADHAGLARFLQVRGEAVPQKPDSLADPKRALVDLARRSRKRSIRDDMVPAKDTTVRVGPGYASRVIEFASEHWRPAVASRHSPSLAKAIAALHRWARR